MPNPAAPIDIHTLVGCGQTWPEQKVAIVDPETHRRCAPDQIGEIWVAGPSVARGYWRDEEKTQARFFHHPRTGERLYRTGDLGRYLPDGNIEFLGREDFQVKIRGHRIELGEIETALTQHPLVQAAVVNALGEASSHRRLVAYIVPGRKDESPIADETAATPPNPMWAAALQAGERHAEEIPPSSDLTRQMMQRFDRLTAAYLARALRALGAYAKPGEAYTVDDLLTHSRVLPRYRKWLLRCLNILTEAGFLRRTGECYESIRALPNEGVSPALWDEIESQVKGAHTALIRRAGENLSAIITGDAHAAQMLFPEGEAQQAEQLYAENFHHCNLVIQAALQAAVQAWPAEKPIRVLEIGAGVGSTTDYVLPVLPPDRTRYHYTDISRYFMQLGQKRFAAYPFIHYGLLDIEKDPPAQGYEPHRFDIILAASVLHATRDIAETLRHIRSLLAPGGMLLLLEETRFHWVFNLSSQSHSVFISSSNLPATIWPNLEMNWATSPEDKNMNTTLKITIFIVIIVAALASLAVLGAGFALAQTPTPWGGYGPGYGMMGNGSHMGSGGMTPALAPGASVGSGIDMNTMHQWMSTTGGMHTIIWDGLAKALDLTPNDLNTQLASGKTLTQIAETQGVTQEQLAAALETSVKAGLDKAVADGVLTQAQAEQMLTYMSGNYEWMITHMSTGMGSGAGNCHGNFAPQGNS